MTRRAERRRWAIVGVLAERGPSTAPAIAEALYRNAGAIYYDLMVLEEDEARVVSYWGGTVPGTELRRRMYRLSTDDERGAHRRRRSLTELFFDPASVPPPRRRWLSPAMGGVA